MMVMDMIEVEVVLVALGKMERLKHENQNEV